MFTKDCQFEFTFFRSKLIGTVEEFVKFVGFQLVNTQEVTNIVGILDYYFENSNIFCSNINSGCSRYCNFVKFLIDELNVKSSVDLDTMVNIYLISDEFKFNNSFKELSSNAKIS